MADRVKRELFDLAGDLTRKGMSFVIATVVRRDGFTSAHQGDMAIIDDAGGFHGWVGGGCTRPTVEREAKTVLASKTARLISLSPEPERDPRPGVLALPMTCSSGGTVEIYLDPVIASPRVALFGRSPIIAAIARVARAIGYLVDVADPDVQRDEVPAADRVFASIAAPELDGAQLIVVGTMGELDEDAVVRALAIKPAYLGVIASRRRFALLRDALIARGIGPSSITSIANPAGLDLGAREAGEVAISILAQMVARRNGIVSVDESRSSAGPSETNPAIPVATKLARRSLPLVTPLAETTAIDPVCQMTVEIASAKHVAEHDGKTFYFCCGGCKTKFLARPHTFLTVSAGGRP